MHVPVKAWKAAEATRMKQLATNNRINTLDAILCVLCVSVLETDWNRMFVFPSLLFFTSSLSTNRTSPRWESSGTWWKLKWPMKRFLWLSDFCQIFQDFDFYQIFCFAQKGSGTKRKNKPNQTNQTNKNNCWARRRICFWTNFLVLERRPLNNCFVEEFQKPVRLRSHRQQGNLIVRFVFFFIWKQQLQLSGISEERLQ